MTKRLIALFLILATALASAPVGTAQTSASDRGWAALRSLPTGTKLSVYLTSGETIKGALTRVSETALTVSRKGMSEEFERGRIRKVYRVGGASVGKATLIGLGIGAGAGAAIGAGVSAGDRHESGEAALPVVMFGAGGALVGAITGLVSGLAGRRRELVYESQ